MSVDDSEQARHLRRDLVHPEHRLLYLSSPGFHAAIDMLAAMLPAWVDGLAAQATMQDAAFETAVAQTIADTIAVAVDNRPHSRACGIHNHAHGVDCHPNCPTCHGIHEMVVS